MLIVQILSNTHASTITWPMSPIYFYFSVSFSNFLFRNYRSSTLSCIINITNNSSFIVVHILSFCRLIINKLTQAKKSVSPVFELYPKWQFSTTSRLINPSNYYSSLYKGKHLIAWNLQLFWILFGLKEISDAYRINKS